MSADIKSSFLADTSNHEMTVRLDHNVYRHIRFKRPGDSCYWFELVTWPHHLCISGDMGTYVFSRTEDMFRFFRTDQLEINEDYWSEKVVSSDRIPVKKFDVEAVRKWFRENLRDTLREWSNKEHRRDIIRQVRELFDFIDDMSEEDVRRAIDDVCVDDRKPVPGIGASVAEWNEYRSAKGKQQVFVDMWEVDFTAYTYRFLWCLHAIVWGIQKYDGAKVAQGAAS